jgi:hypothetical protein
VGWAAAGVVGRGTRRAGRGEWAWSSCDVASASERAAPHVRKQTRRVGLGKRFGRVGGAGAGGSEGRLGGQAK